jgi:hypothetical protein
VTANEVTAAFVALTPQRQMQVLSRLAFELTISARCWHPGQADEGVAVRKLSSLNELQHTVTGQLMHLAAGDGQKYPDPVFVAVLFEKAQGGHSEQELRRALEKSWQGQ